MYTIPRVNLQDFLFNVNINASWSECINCPYSTKHKEGGSAERDIVHSGCLVLVSPLELTCDLALSLIGEKHNGHRYIASLKLLLNFN